MSDKRFFRWPAVEAERLKTGRSDSQKVVLPAWGESDKSRMLDGISEVIYLPGILATILHHCSLGRTLNMFSSGWRFLPALLELTVLCYCASLPVPNSRLAFWVYVIKPSMGEEVSCTLCPVYCYIALHISVFICRTAAEALKTFVVDLCKH